MISFAVILKMFILISITIVWNEHLGRPRNYRNILQMEAKRDSLMIQMLREHTSMDTTIVNDSEK